MPSNWIYLPILALIILLIIIWALAAFRRISAVKSKTLSIKAIQNIEYQAMPDEILLPGRNYDNLFQQPVLFIILLSFLAIHQIDAVIWQACSWLFVVARGWHSIEHIIAKNLKRRTFAFAIASITLWGMWLAFLCDKII